MFIPFYLGKRTGLNGRRGPITTLGSGRSRPGGGPVAAWRRDFSNGRGLMPRGAPQDPAAPMLRSNSSLCTDKIAVRVARRHALRGGSVQTTIAQESDKGCPQAGQDSVQQNPGDLGQIDQRADCPGQPKRSGSVRDYRELCSD